ncbi:hypothetical protein [Bdellovibrio sp. HCB288]|uniref:hypothetical protein n=1 Tax=Bdellovibrio sp. HCB288 TaxID=3394355 RepID=UPI0039B45EC8
MKALNLVITLISVLAFNSAHASSGQALRQLIRDVQVSQGLLYNGTVEAQICEDSASSQYLLFANNRSEIFAVSIDSGFSSSVGDEGWIAADTAELINLLECTHAKVRINQ